MLSDKAKRCLMHIPVGLVAVLGVFLNPMLGVLMLVGFIVYELNEDRHIKDGAWIDTAGFVWGTAIGIIVWFIWRLICQ